MKFLLGSNLKAHCGETEVRREADISGEKCVATAELSQPVGLAVGRGAPGKWPWKKRAPAAAAAASEDSCHQVMQNRSCAA